MAAMPIIRSRLHELFGPERVLVPDNSATLVSQGAAWIAHDSQPLVLAKRIELEMARGSRLPLLHAGTPMPLDGQVHQDNLHLYCTDPSDGTAKFPIVVPTQLSEQPQASDERTALGMITVAVDKTAPPLTERLELDITMDDDLILKVTARSAQHKDQASESYFDLEFGIGLPGSADPKAPDAAGSEAAASTGGLTIRANVADRQDQALIPGDVLYRHDSRAFQRLPGPGPGNQGTAPRAPILPALLRLQTRLGRPPLPLRLPVAASAESMRWPYERVKPVVSRAGRRPPGGGWSPG